STYPLISGQYIAYIASILKGVLLYRCRIYFTVDSINKKVYILIRGIISSLRIISGLPKTL
ncbi:hypothetical protein V2W45_1247637, partial [Cenococcum geophilum]